MTRTRLLNSYVDNLTMAESLEKIEIIIQNKIPTQHVVINANKINLMAKDPKLAAIVNDSPLINADGSSILLAGKILGKPLVERVTGIDLFMELLILCENKGYRPYFFGATQEVIEEMLEIIQIDYPRIEVAGYRNGYFEENYSLDIAQEIHKTKADILFVAFSSPKKEYWIHQYLSELNIPFVMGVGGSFDVLAGKTKRAPKIWQKFGMEWVYRFMQEPKRMAHRYLIGNSVFLLHVCREKFISKKR
ncbi:WecB/TagA/CpsF family glycosyltransferase [Carnobacterium maltaromaticum]|uniref:WecB/TagA/CpsF family glycosyltransferase n=1 Tax=Carnobacterium maltaromaticum TaxID=2751 RepID=A0AAW9JVG6_CARML|nr:WecB/TagA/CpsF family glycosyltransferase [Carnobacterium maltaromaticum]MDZ5759573.1 WecB/TagA/CpsF family glycosyltransferase [Carnobacterium maltaromaticum]